MRVVINKITKLIKYMLSSRGSDIELLDNNLSSNPRKYFDSIAAQHSSKQILYQEGRVQASYQHPRQFTNFLMCFGKNSALYSHIYCGNV